MKVVSRRAAAPLVLFAVLLIALVPSAGWGRRSGRPAAAVSEADLGELRRAEEALASHDLAAAEKQLVAVYRRTRAAEALYLLGAVARERGDLLAMHDYFRRYVGDPAIDANTPHAEEAQKFLGQSHGPAGELQVVGEAGALVVVDGRLTGALPLSQPLLLAVGSHQVSVEAGRKALSVQLQIADGRGTEVRFVPDYDALLVSVPPAVLVLPDWTGPASVVQRRLLQETQQAVRRANHAVFDTDTALARAPQYKSCLREQRCRLQLAEKSEIDFVLTLHVTTPAAGSGAFTTKAELYSPRIPIPAATAQRDCPSCTVEQAATQLAAAIEELVQKGGARPRGSLKITSQPAGAVIGLGELVLGKTPATLALWVGEYELTLALPDRPPISVPANINDGATAAVQAELPSAQVVKTAELPPTAPATGGRLKRPLWRLVVGGIAIAGGAILLGNGISAAVVDGHCATDLGSSPPYCDLYFATGTAAAGLLAGGAALTLGGIILVALPGPKAPAAP